MVMAGVIRSGRSPAAVTGPGGRAGLVMQE